MLREIMFLKHGFFFHISASTESVLCSDNISTNILVQSQNTLQKQEKLIAEYCKSKV